MSEKTIPPLDPCPFCGTAQDLSSISESNCVVFCKNQECCAEGPYVLPSDDDGSDPDFPGSTGQPRHETGDSHRSRIAAAWNRRRGRVVSSLTFGRKLEVLEDLLRSLAVEATTPEMWDALCKSATQYVSKRRLSAMPWGGMPWICVRVDYSDKQEH